MSKTDVILVNGSPRKEGNCNFLLETLKEKLDKKGISSKIISASECINDAKYPFCTVCSSPCNMSCYKGTKLEKAFIDIRDSKVAVFASPVYFGSMSAQLKAFFDKTRAVRGNRWWQDKFACAISVGASKYGGQETTIRAIQDCLFVDGFTVFGSSSISAGVGHQGVSANGDAKEDTQAIEKLDNLAARICDLVK